MTTYPYIILSDSIGSIIKRFKVIKFDPIWQDNSNFQITAGGGIDKSVGATIRLFHYTFRVYEDELDSDYGDLRDLITLYELKNPSPPMGVASDLLTLTDHYGDTFSVKFKMDLAPSPVTTQLEGPNALHYVNITLIQIPNVGGSGS